MQLNPSDILLMIVYPALLSLVQLLIPQKTRKVHLWIGFAVLCSVSLGLVIYLSQANIGVLLIALAVGIPLIFAVVRFIVIPYYKKYKALAVLPNILGAIDWGKRSQNLDTFLALESIQTSFDFMGFGFSKYVKAMPNRQTSDGKANIKDSLLWKKLEEIYLSSPKQELRILLMNPLAYEIEKYSKLLKEKHPDRDVGDDLYFSLDCLRDVQKTFGNMIQVKFYPYSLTYKPSFRLFFCNDNELYISFYKWGTTGIDLPYVHLKKQEEETFFLPFHLLFDYLWEHGEAADIENMPFTMSLEDIYLGHRFSIERIKKHIRHQLPAHLREIPFEQLRIATASVAGRDSALAILMSVESGQYDCILPVVVRTPGKYTNSQDKVSQYNDLGDYGVRGDTLKRLKQAVEQRSSTLKSPCYLLNAIFIETDARSWINTTTQNESDAPTNNLPFNRAINSPCLACHIYIYYVRAMLCQRLGIKKMIGGDRICHDKTIKINQTEEALNIICRISQKEFGVEFVTPIKTITSNAEIRKPLDRYGLSSINDISCVFDGQGAIDLSNYDDATKSAMEEISRRVELDVIRRLETSLHEIYSPHFARKEPNR